MSNNYSQKLQISIPSSLSNPQPWETIFTSNINTESVILGVEILTHSIVDSKTDEVDMFYVQINIIQLGLENTYNYIFLTYFYPVKRYNVGSQLF